MPARFHRATNDPRRNGVPLPSACRPHKASYQTRPSAAILFRMRPFSSASNRLSIPRLGIFPASTLNATEIHASLNCSPAQPPPAPSPLSVTSSNRAQDQCIHIIAKRQFQEIRDRAISSFSAQRFETNADPVATEQPERLDGWIGACSNL